MKEENLLDHRQQNRRIKRSLKASIEDLFPVKAGGKRLEVSNITLEDNLSETDFPAQKETRVNRDTWEMPIKADIKIIDDSNGRIIDQKTNVKIGAIPKITNRFSAIVKGNEYQVSNQIRRKPGVFSRQKKNGQLESEFNLAKGANFALQIDPQKQLFYFTLKTGTRRYHLYTLLTSMGMSDSKIKQAWGEKLFRKNKKDAMNTEESELVDLHQKLVGGKTPDKISDVRKELAEYFNETSMDGGVNELTLGTAYDKASAEAMLDASVKLLNINRGEDKPDERDSLIFKELYAPDDLLKEYFKGNKQQIRRKMQNSLSNREKVREVVPANIFTKPIRGFFTTSDLSATPPQTNPVAMAVNARKTTSMGPGGIQSEHAITMETRDVHPSQFGFLDGLSTPEGPKIGVNVGLASEVQKRGNDMVTPVVMPDGSEEFKTPLEMHKATVGFPDQFDLKNGKPVAQYDEVKAMRESKPVKVPKGEIDFWLRSPRTMFDFGTNMVPFLATTQGNRGATAARMITQALPLDNPETPNSVVKRDPNSDETYEDLMGDYMLPTLEDETGDPNSSGEVTKVTKDYIHVNTDKGDKVKIGLYNDFPLNQDGYLNTEPLVKKGDKIKGDTLLAKSNYTDEKGRLALGKNLTVAYLSYKGNSFEDGATITESAAEKLTHSTIDRINVFHNPKESILEKKKFRSFYPEELTPENLDKLDERGLPKVGETFHSGEALLAFLTKKEGDLLDKSLKKLHKAIYTPYGKKVKRWEEDDPGKVVDVRESGRNIDIYVKSKHKFKEGDKLCVDEETEILTDKGWKTITELRGSEEFCTLNPNTHKIEYQKASQINIYDHKGEMYHIANAAIDQMVTKDHSMYINPRNPVSMDWGFLKASEIFGKRVKYKKSGIWGGSKLEIPEIIEHDITPEQFSTFMGWYLSEGNTCRVTKGYVTTIHQDKKVNPENYAEIKELIEEMGLTPICQKDRISFNSKSMYLYLNRFGHSHEKYVPKCIKDAYPQLISLFIDSYVRGDGTITDTGQRCIITSSIEMRDDLMELILKTGKAANYRLHREKGHKGNFGTSNHDTWDIREIRTKLTPSVNHGHVHEQDAQIEEYINYKGKVGCPTTPNGIIYIRRNGKTSWTGNSSRYGDKHIIGKIIPDDEAPHRPDGTPVDIMVNPQGVQGRMNMGQLLDTAAGKIAEKTGKPYEVLNFDNPDGDDAKRVKDKMEELGIEADEILTDGKNGEPLENPVFVGNRQYLKLRHLVKKKMAAHSFGTYDIDEQPAGKGAQKVGVLDTYSYLAHGAKNLMREATTIKGQENEEYFRNLQFGLPPSKPKSPAVFDKMMNYLKVAGVDVHKEGNKMQLIPLTDKKTEELSKGEIPNPGQMLIGKNLASKKGGLFDKELTGGQKGENYNHISLPKRLPNPMSETAIKSVLDLTNKQYDAIMAGKDDLNGKTGSEAIISALEDLDVEKEYEKTKKELKDAPKSSVNKLNTKVRILDALNKKGMDAKEAYTMSKVLVIPPKFRPVYPLPSGDLQVSDINKHYRDVGLKAHGLKQALEEDSLTKEDEIDFTNKLYYSVKAMEGFVDPITYGKQKYKGALKDLGETKKGLIFGKAWTKRQDLSGRSTIVPEPTFGLDEIGVPEPMAKEIFKPFVVRKLKEDGMRAGKALKEVKDDSDLAKRTLQRVMDEKSVVVNRAPSLHKHSVQAFKPKLVSGKEIRLNPLVVSGYNADFDGDTMSVQVPATYEGEQDAKSMYPSRILFKHGDNSLVPELSQEYLYGMSKISRFGKNTGKTFKSIEDAKEAGLKPTDVFKMNGKKMTIGQHEINKVLPEKYQDYDREFRYSQLNDLLEKIAKNEDSDTFRKVIDHYKDLGALYQYKHGGTVSINDMVFDRSYRDDLIKKYKPRIEKLDDPKDQVKGYIKLVEEIEEAQNKELAGKNRMLDLVEGGAVSRSKAGNIRQVLSAPGIVAGTSGEPINIPILKSYSEGLDTFDYFNTMPGVRKGVVDKSVNTQESGALNKQLLAVNRRLVIVEEDCGTTKGREYEISNDNIMGRAALNSVQGVVKRNEIIDGDVISAAKQKGIDSLEVRTPLQCESSNGICALCYGTMPDGSLPSIGENVGVLESQALTERATQLTLQTFHTGGAASGDDGVVGSFPRLKELLKVPQRLSGKATLAPIRGTVKKLQKNEIGGYDVQVGSKEVTIEPGRDPVVEVGDRVKKGDRLSDGKIKPQELGDLKSHFDAQKYITDEISSVYGGAFHDKTIETVVRGISDNAEVTEAPEDSNWFKGDKASASYLNKINREREMEDLEPIKFKNYFKSIDTLNVDNPDWFTKITTNRVKAGLSKGVAKMQWANIAGKDPIPAYLYGEDFGNPDKKTPEDEEEKGFF